MVNSPGLSMNEEIRCFFAQNILPNIHARVSRSIVSINYKCFVCIFLMENLNPHAGVHRVAHAKDVVVFAPFYAETSFLVWIAI